MSYLNNQKNHATQLVGLALATAMLTSLFAVTTYSRIRSRSYSVAKTNGATIPLTQPQTPALKANGKIAFVSTADDNPEIYTMNADGSGLTRLTFDPESDGSPAWSPDGTKILFSRNSRNIFVMNADGSNQKQLDNSRSATESDNGYAWSPDGTKIVFVRADARGSKAIFVMNADGSDQRRLTESRNYLSPGWSPDGTKIVFSLWYFPGNRIYVMNADGSDQRVIGSWDRYFQAAWSPDGSKLALAGNDGIYLMNVDGSNETRITQSSEIAMYLDPAWSPDGSRIAFTKWTDCDWNDCYTPHIFVVNVDGSNPVKLADNLSTGRHPWSPDSSKIVFTDGRDILVANPDGTGIAKITNTNKSAGAPSWQSIPLAVPPLVNPIDDAQFFVRQHYRDFLNREPDAAGLAFWTDNITKCTDPARRPAAQTETECIDRQEVTTSAAFFLSPEFQYTGYFVYRLYKGSLIRNGAGRFPTYQEFLRDVRQVASGIIQNNQVSAAKIEENKKKFAEEFTQRAEFRSLYDPLSNFDYVERLFQTTGISVSVQEKQALVESLNSQTETRASVLQKVVDGAVVIAEGNQEFTTAYGQAFYQKEFNAAFVLMEYFGYLHRDPDAAGYQHWLDKLNLYGNYIDAEMVKSFITSPEYRARFGQP